MPPKANKPAERFDKDGSPIRQYRSIVGISADASIHWLYTPDEPEQLEYDPVQQIYIMHINLFRDDSADQYGRLLQEMTRAEAKRTGGIKHVTGKREREQE